MARDEWKPEDEKDPQEELLRRLNKLLPDPENPDVPSPLYFMGQTDPELEQRRQVYWARQERCFRLLQLVVGGVMHHPGPWREVLWERKLPIGDLVVWLEEDLTQAFEKKFGKLPEPEKKK